MCCSNTRIMLKWEEFIKIRARQSRAIDCDSNDEQLRARPGSNNKSSRARYMHVFCMFEFEVSIDTEFGPFCMRRIYGIEQKVLGVNPLEGFDMVKAAYSKKRKDAERRDDEVAAAQLEKAYEKIMMSQLKKRKNGETFGSFKVSKDIKYADKLPVIPWAPRFTKSEAKDIQINMAISTVFNFHLNV
ncbi:hypothetical protein AAHA92_17774 [Salvia divinorum]|uniref:Uncharacterized protein n=1 Tax=Salvia divinorum TaxID=28513 RepID=A0ABD1GZV8_SALDI